jgi:hypothetical protein
VHGVVRWRLSDLAEWVMERYGACSLRAKNDNEDRPSTPTVARSGLRRHG